MGLCFKSSSLSVLKFASFHSTLMVMLLEMLKEEASKKARNHGTLLMLHVIRRVGTKSLVLLCRNVILFYIQLYCIN